MKLLMTSASPQTNGSRQFAALSPSETRAADIRRAPPTVGVGAPTNSVCAETGPAATAQITATAAICPRRLILASRSRESWIITLPNRSVSEAT